jgi:hypothetical protein
VLSENKSLKCNKIYLLRPDLSLSGRLVSSCSGSDLSLLPVSISQLGPAEQLLTERAGETRLPSAFSKGLLEERYTSNPNANIVGGGHHIPP